jgi:NACHT domain
MSSDPGSPSAYWISGMAGTGKSTIAISICKILKSEGILAGSFFCSRQIGECRDYRWIVPTLSYQLAKISSAFATALVAILSKDFDVVHKEPSEQIKHLLITPWEDVTIFFNPGPLIFAIDALDECQGISVVLKPLVEAIQNNKLRGLKFLFTSRPDQEINKRMHETIPNSNSVCTVQEFILHQVEYSFVRNDIKIYIEQELKDILQATWEVEHLTDLCGKLFIYAATVVKYVKSGDGTIRKKQRLAKSLDNKGNPENLKTLYSSILSSVMSHSDPGEIKEDWKVIHTIVSLGSPLSCNAIASLMELETEIVEHLVARLQAVFYISETDQAVFTFYASFSEFIVNNTSGAEPAYNANILHSDLSLACFTTLAQLEFNMCNHPSSFIPDAEVRGLGDKISEALQYSCQYWNFHCIQCNLNDNIEQPLNEFLTEKGVYWIEVMSVLNQFEPCRQAMQHLIEVSIRYVECWLFKNVTSLLEI